MKKRRSTPIPLQIIGSSLRTLLTEGSLTFLAANRSRDDGIEYEDREHDQEQDQVGRREHGDGHLRPRDAGHEVAGERLLYDEVRARVGDERGIGAEEGDLRLLLPEELDDALVADARRDEVDRDREEREQDHVGEDERRPAYRVRRDEVEGEQGGAEELEDDHSREEDVDGEEQPLRVLVGGYLLPVDVVGRERR